MIYLNNNWMCNLRRDFVRIIEIHALFHDVYFYTMVQKLPTTTIHTPLTSVMHGAVMFNNNLLKRLFLWVIVQNIDHSKPQIVACRRKPSIYLCTSHSFNDCSRNRNRSWFFRYTRLSYVNQISIYIYSWDLTNTIDYSLKSCVNSLT